MVISSCTKKRGQPAIRVKNPRKSGLYNDGYGRVCLTSPSGHPVRPARQRPQDRHPGSAHRPAGVGVVLVSGGFGRRETWADRRVPLGRAHELQGHRPHSPRRDEGHRRTLWRHLEWLHLDRPDDLSRDRGHICAGYAPLHRSRTHGLRPLRAGRVRVGADGHHLRASGRGERPRPAPRHRGRGDRLPGASLSASHDRVDRRSPLDEPRRSLRPLPAVLRAGQRHPRRSRRRRSG